MSQDQLGSRSDRGEDRVIGRKELKWKKEVYWAVTMLYLDLKEKEKKYSEDPRTAQW